uniref:C-type lectin domain-containing protein n=1 Tax=Gasterosteus aculeatus aculeatus TaxID=481459 RepID=A0AAQ4NVA3_GASAC
MSQTGRWNDVSCTELNTYICKAARAHYPAPSVKPTVYGCPQVARNSSHRTPAVSVLTRPVGRELQVTRLRLREAPARHHPAPQELLPGTRGKQKGQTKSAIRYRGTFFLTVDVLQLFHEVDFSLKKSWGAAREDCVSRGANLVSIHNQEEEEFLALYSKDTSKWIGLRHNPTEGGYSWSDGTPLSHTNWGHGEPNNHEGREECVEMVSSVNGSRSWWNDLNCDAHQDWICMITKGKNPQHNANPAPEWSFSL